MGALGETRDVRRQFWLLIRAGMERRKAALALGLSDWTGKAWVSASDVIALRISQLAKGTGVAPDTIRMGQPVTSREVV